MAFLPRFLASGTDSVAAVQGGTWSIAQSGAWTVGVSGSVAVTGIFWQATQPISAASLPLPAGAATETTLAAMSAKLPAALTAGGSLKISINESVTTLVTRLTDGGAFYDAAKTGQLPTALVGGRLDINIGASSATVPVSGTFFQATQPVSAASLPLPAGAATEATLAARIPVNGQALMAASVPVTFASNQSALPVTGTFFQATQPVSGSVSVSGTATVTQGTSAALAAPWVVKVTDGTNTMPTGDAVARALYVRQTDGTNSTTVKAASTAAVAADTALVVAVSPNNVVVVQGQQSARTTANITSAASVVGPVTATGYNVATVTVTGTYNNVSFVFEGSDDGSSWFSINSARVESSISEPGALALTNTIRAWDVPVGAFTQFRVRATTWTSGTAVIGVSLQSMPYEPAPAITPARQNVCITFQAVAPATADTLLSLVKVTGSTAAAGATSITAATGRRLRINSVAFTLKANAAAAAFATLNLRHNATGATVIGSTSIMRVDLGLTAATIGSSDKIVVPFDGGFEIGGTESVGASLAAQATTNIISITMNGYEYTA